MNDLVVAYQQSEIFSEMKNIQSEIENKHLNSLPFQTKKPSNSFKKFWVLYKRLVIAMFFSQSDRTRLILPSIVMFIEVLASYQLPLLTTHVRDRIGSIIFPMVVFLMWASSITVTGIQGYEVFKREFNKGFYSTEVFFGSSQLAHITQDSVLNLVSSSIIYWTLGLYASPSNFFAFLFFNLFTYLMWIQISLILIPILRSFSAAVSLVGALDFICIWTSGYWVLKRNLPAGLKQFNLINPVGAAIEGTISNEFKHISFEDPKTGVRVPGTFYLEELEYESTLFSRFMIVFCYYIILVILRYVSLKLSNKNA